MGKAIKYGDNINTDVIIPARYLNTTDPEELKEHCMEDEDPSFVDRVEKGDIMVAGKNFGTGSSREHAPIALKASGLQCVIAESYARIFYRNSFNIGFPILESKEAATKIAEGDEIEVNFQEGLIRNKSKDEEYKCAPIPEFMQNIIDKGGLVEYTRSKLG